MKYRPEIDGLRALAVVPVILFHAGFELFSGGFVGVDVFFVISGYLITTILIEDIEKQQFSLVNFYERRARRILPALFFVMFVCIPFAWMWMMPNQLKDFSQSLVAVSFFASNILFWIEGGYFGAAAEEKPLLHTWSLAVEEQYYVMFPIFLLLAWRYGKNRVFWTIVVLAVISLTLSEWGWRNKANANFYLAPARAWELFAGSIAAFIVLKRGVQSNNVFALIGVALIVFSIFVYDEGTPFPSVYSLVPVVGVVLIVIYANGKTLVGKLLSSKVFVGIGLISYSAYLWHQPLFAFARLRHLTTPSELLMGSLSLFSIVLAFLSWRYIEKPFRSASSISSAFIKSFASIGLLAFVLIGLVGHIYEGFTSRFSEKVLDIANNNIANFEAQISDCQKQLDIDPTVQGGCLLGPNKTSNSFALVGDSHAAALQNSLSQFAGDFGVSGLGLSYASCPPLAKAITSHDDTCMVLRSSIFSNAGMDSLPRTVVVAARWTLLLEQSRYVNNYGFMESGSDWTWDLGHRSEKTYQDKMAGEIVDSLNAIVASGRNLIIVYPVPELGWDAPKLLSKHLRFSDIKLTQSVGAVAYTSFLERNKNAYLTLDKVGELKSVERIYPSDTLCNPELDLCLAHMDGIPLYYDDDHLSPYAADIVSRHILSLLAQ